MFNRWFIAGSDKSWIIVSCLEYSHDLKLGALSILLAIIASYTAFHSVSSISNAPTRSIWLIRLILGVIAMGAGI